MESKTPRQQQETRFLTPLHAFSLSFGCAVGWGAFAMPGTTFLKQAGPLGSFFAMQIATFIMLLISYNYYYMIRKHPVNGGQYVYTRLKFGKTHGFVCAWFLLLSYFLIVPLNATAIFLIVRTIFGSALQKGFHYVIAGHDIFGAEVLVSVIALVIFALVALKGLHFSVRIQSILAIVFLASAFLLLIGGIVSGKATVANFRPHFYPRGNPFLQIIGVAATGPWAFVGFETVPQYAAHFRFQPEKVKPVMDLAVLASGFLYILLTLLSATVVPAGYASWSAYIDALPMLKGAMALPTYYFAYTVMGYFGSVVFSVCAFCAIATGILGSFLATSQMLCLLSEDGMMPHFLSRKNEEGTPYAATGFVLFLSVIAPFFGRTFLNWVVSMSSIGAAIGFFYTSMASRSEAKADGNRDMVVIGTVSAAFSFLFAFLLLVPVPGLDVSLDMESYVILAVWCVLGLVLYLAMRGRVRDT